VSGWTGIHLVDKVVIERRADLPPLGLTPHERAEKELAGVKHVGDVMERRRASRCAVGLSEEAVLDVASAVVPGVFMSVPAGDGCSSLTAFQRST